MKTASYTLNEILPRCGRVTACGLLVDGASIGLFRFHQYVEVRS